MGGDGLFQKRRAARAKRQEEILEQKPNNWLLIAEGEKTEPLYFETILELVNETLPSKYKIKYDTCGKGYNTTSLVKVAEKIQYKYDSIMGKKTIPYGKVFVIFDKDDFSESDFNEAVALCRANGFIALWSNQAIEFWFLLYFNFCQGKINRSLYESRLNKALKAKGATDFSYRKNDVTCFKQIIELGSLKNARKRAKKIHDEFVDSSTKEAKCESCTTIYKFFDEIDIRNSTFDLKSTSEIFDK